MRIVAYTVLGLIACAPLHAEPPPLIDRDALFGEIQIAAAQVAPDGRYMAFLKPYRGVRNLWVKRTAEPFASARPVSAEAQRPIPEYRWSRDGKYLLYIQDQGGDENFNLYAVDVAAAVAASGEAPAARNITAVKGARVEIYDLPRDEPDTAFVGLNDRDKAWHDLYRLRLSTGERTLLRRNTERIANWVFDHQGRLRLAVRTTADGTELLRVDRETLTPVYGCTITEECAPVGFAPGDARVYVRTNKDSNLIGLVLLDPATRAATRVEADPEKRVDLASAMSSERTDRLLAMVYEDDKPRVYWKDPGFAHDYRWLKEKLNGAEPRFASGSRDEHLWVISSYSDVEPGETFLYDRRAHTLALQFRNREQIPRAALAPTQSIRYNSLDGTEIQAYLTLPRGVPPQGLPLMVFPHGGPWYRDTWGFNSFAQFFANRGYAVLQPNFRGSTGSGKAFLNAGNGQWGRTMQDDLTAGVKHLIAAGTVDAKRVGIAGGSYGGYATLAGVAFTPDLYAAAVSIVGPSNLITLLASVPPYWESFRAQLYRRMADPGTEQGRALLRAESPLNSADHIRTPLMVVQGANDPRVNKRESDQIVIAAREHGVPVEYLVAPDEGHG
ncbi:MAG: S9 family peptidase, partial [Gammaproteobacteria bacterium]|nr:S9 family peptidase [Gammaproteobacteria bacterium]